MATLNVYRSTVPSMNYIFKNGKPAIFVQGVFRTNVPSEIEELNNEVALNHPSIYVKKGEEVIDEKMIDPMVALRANIIKEYLEAEAAATNPDRDMGTSTQKGVVATNSRDVAEAAAGGSGMSAAARLLASAKAEGSNLTPGNNGQR